jgi:hypothetical protein
MPAPAGPPSNPVAPSGYEVQQATPIGAPQAPPYGAPQDGAPQAPPYGGPQYGPPPAPQYGAPQYGPPSGPQYGAPQYGAPQYGQYPQQGAYAPGGQWAQAPKTNGLAIASLCTSLGGFVTVGLAGVVGLILGIVALKKIGTSGDGGKGLAIAGIVVGALMTVFFLFYVTVMIGLVAGTWGTFTTTTNGAAASALVNAGAGFVR